MSDKSTRPGSQPSAPGYGHTDPGKLPSLPDGPSRVVDLPEDFAGLLSQRPLDPGDVIGGRYRLLDRLGEGGMGQVFVAENQAIRSRVAIKVLRTQLLSDPSFRRRFQQEAEAIAAITHRNVVRFFDVVVGDPTFLVMEFVPGPTLAERLKRDQLLPPAHAAAIAERLCWALEAVHRAGLIHRDIKPANVILTPDLEASEEPKLLDFGLVKRAGDASDEQLTRTGQVVGTPLYMAPEQISGQPVDARADVYSLGCLLYHMLVGRPPFEGDDVQVLFHHVKTEPPPLPASVPRPLAAIVTRAVAKDRSRRFATMADMAAALQLARSTWEPAAKRRAGGDGPRWSRMLAATALALPLALGLGYWAARHGRAATSNLLLLTTNPEGATVELDGTPLPQPTPTVAAGIAPGRHTLRLWHHGLATVARQLTVGADERQVIDVVLPPSSHRIDVSSTPRGAAIYVDDSLVAGETPTAVEVSDDDFHQLRLEKEGFETVTTSLAPGDGRRAIAVELPKEEGHHGLVLVDADHPAEVLIDGRDTGFVTPTVGLRVSSGGHTVEVRDHAGATASARVDVAQGQTVRLSLTLQRRRR